MGKVMDVLCTLLFAITLNEHQTFAQSDWHGRQVTTCVVKNYVVPGSDRTPRHTFASFPLFYSTPRMSLFWLPRKLKRKNTLKGQLCEGKQCGDMCGISPFGPRYCVGHEHKNCILLPAPPRCTVNRAPQLYIKFENPLMHKHKGGGETGKVNKMSEGKIVEEKRDLSQDHPDLECFSGTASPRDQNKWGFSRYFDWNPLGSQCLFRFPTNSQEQFAKVSPICLFRFEDWNKVEVEGTGLKEWQVTVPSCGGTLSSEGTISSPGHPGPYSNNEDCEWVVNFSENQKIMLEFEVFDVDNGNSNSETCRHDFLEIRNGPNFTSPIIGDKRCGSTLPDPIMSDGNELHLHFHSDETMTGHGFKMTVSGVGPGVQSCEDEIATKKCRRRQAKGKCDKTGTRRKCQKTCGFCV